jgi:hypothetical protein
LKPAPPQHSCNPDHGPQQLKTRLSTTHAVHAPESEGLPLRAVAVSALSWSRSWSSDPVPHNA